MLFMPLRETGFRRTSKVKDQVVWGGGAPKNRLKVALVTGCSDEPLPLRDGVSREIKLIYCDHLFYLLMNQKSK